MLKRPIGVWIASVGYLLLQMPAAWLVLQFYLETPPLTEAQRAYFGSLGWLDYAIGAGTSLLMIVGLVDLFSLRRTAVALLGVAFAVDASYSLVHVLTTNWVEADGSIGALMGPVVQLAIYRYAWRLGKQGVLV